MSKNHGVMMKAIQILVLLVLTLSLNALAEDPKPQQISADSRAKIDLLIKHFKTMQLKKAFELAKVDKDTMQKAFNNLTQMMRDQKTNAQELKKDFQEALIKRFVDAGLAREKVEEVLANYKSLDAPIKEAIMKAIKDLVHTKIPNAQ